MVKNIQIIVLLFLFAMADVMVVMLLMLTATGEAQAGERYNALEDAAVVQARVWQSGGKARPLISSDGKVVFAYGESMPKLTCSPTRACDVEMQPGEKVKNIILGDSANWTQAAAESIESGKTVEHVIFQPRDNEVESNVIITTDRRTYHIKLYAPKGEGVYLNRVGFYYPQDLVTSWQEQEGEVQAAKEKETKTNVLVTPVALDKLGFDYKITGSGSFKPLRVFDDGERVYMEMPPSLVTSESPIVLLLDAKGEAMVVNYRREEDPDTRKVHYVVDKLFDRCELRLGSEKVQIISKRYKPNGWSWSW